MFESFKSLRDNPISNAVVGAPEKQQPGVVQPGQGVNPANLVRDPTTGFYFDPATGTTYQDPNGHIPVTNPNIAQQVASNFNNSQAFSRHIATVRENQDALGQNLQGVISGRTPSAAGMQLGQGLEQIQNQQLSQAAGVQGAASPLANLMAMRNTGSAAVTTNNDAAIAKIKEQDAARQAYMQLLATQGQQDISGGVQYANLANTGQGDQQGLNTGAGARNTKNAYDYGMAILKGGGDAMTGGGAGAAGG